MRGQYAKQKAFYFKPENFYAFCKEILNLHWLDEIPNAEMAWFLVNPALKPFRMMAVPRDCHKSTLAVNGYPVWDICKHLYEDDLDVSHLLDSASLNLVHMQLRTLKKHFRYNETLIEWFGEFYNPEAWTRDDFFIKQQWAYAKRMGRTEGTAAVRSVLAEVTGLHYTNVEADDWVTAKNVKTDLQLWRGKQHYREILNVLDKSKGQLRITCTFWHYDDAYQHIINTQAEHFDFMIEPIYRVLPDGTTKLFYPKKYPMEEIERKRNQEGEMFAPQYLLEPVEQDTKMFPDEFWQEISRSEMPPIKWVYIAYDPAGKGQDEWRRSMDVMGAFAVDYSMKNMYLIDGYQKPAMDPDEVLSNLMFLCKIYKDKLRLVLVEDVNFYKFIGKMVEDYMVEHGVRYPIVASKIDSTRQKESSQAILQPRWKAKGIFVVRELPEEIKIEVRDEFMHYPKSRYNDWLDAFTMVERETRYTPQETEEKIKEATNYIQNTDSGVLINADMFFVKREKMEDGVEVNDGVW